MRCIALLRCAVLAAAGLSDPLSSRAEEPAPYPIGRELPAFAAPEAPAPPAEVPPEPTGVLRLEDALAEKGWTPTRVDAYRTRFPRSLPAEARSALAEGRVDAVTFTSASSVRGFVGALGAVRGSPRVVAIGPVTAREARVHGA